MTDNDYESPQRNALYSILPNELTITHHLFLYTIVCLPFLPLGLYYVKRISLFSFVHFLFFSRFFIIRQSDSQILTQILSLCVFLSTTLSGFAFRRPLHSPVPNNCLRGVVYLLFEFAPLFTRSIGPLVSRSFAHIFPFPSQQIK